MRSAGSPKPTFDYESAMNKAMAPLNRLVGAVVDLEAKFRAQMVKADADEALNSFTKDAENLWYDPNTGYMAQKGRNANVTYPQYRDKLQQLYQERIDGLEDPEVKAAFGSVARQKIQAYDHTAKSHRLQQNGVYIAQSSQDRVTNLVNDAASHYSDPDFMGKSWESISRELDYQKQLFGESDETARKKKTATYDLFQSQKYTSWAQEDPVSALGDFVRNRDGLSYDIRVKTQQLALAAAPSLASDIARYGGAGAINLAQKTDTAGVSKTTAESLGFRGNNPLNIRQTDDKWNGAVGSQKGFVVFRTPEHGIRAGAKVLQSYKRQGRNTCIDIISRFAPATENNTDEYVLAVCGRTGFGQTEQLGLDDQATVKKLMRAMATVEIGSDPYSDETWNAGIAAAFGTGTLPADGARLTARDLKANPEAPTGNEILDSLTPRQKMHVFNLAPQMQSAERAQAASQLNQGMKDSLAVALAEGDQSAKLTEDQFFAVHGQTAEKAYEAYSRQFDSNINRHNFRSMDDRQIQDAVDSFGVVTSADDAKFLEQLKKDAKAVRDDRTKDPMRYAAEVFPELNIKPIYDWTDLGAVREEAEKRRVHKSEIARGLGTNETLFSNAEIALFLKHMGSMDEAHQAAYVEELGTALFNQDENTADSLAIFANQLGEKNQVFALAMGLSSSSEPGSGMARRQIMGNVFRRQKLVDLKNDDVRDIQNRLYGIFANGADSAQAQAAVNAAMNEMAYSLHEGESVSADDCIEKILGEIEERNGKKVFAPTRLRELNDAWYRSSFLAVDMDNLLEDAARDFVKSGKEYKEYNYGGVRINGAQLANLLPQARLQWIADGQYYIINGDRYLTDMNNVPVLLDLNEYIDRRLEKK